MPTKYIDRKLNKKTVGVIEGSFGAIIKGSAEGYFPKILDTHILFLKFARSILSTIFIYVYSELNEHKIKNIFARDKLKFHGLSILISIRIILFLIAYKYTNLTIASLIFFAHSLYITLLEGHFLKKKVSYRNIFLVFLNLGVFAIIIIESISISDGETFVFGYVIMFISSLFATGEYIIKKAWADELYINEWIFYQNFTPAILMLPLLFFFPPPSFDTFVYILIFGFLVGIVAYSMNFASIKILKISTNRIIAFLEPVTAIFIGIFVFNEPFTALYIVGAIIILMSMFFLDKE